MIKEDGSTLMAYIGLAIIAFMIGVIVLAILINCRIIIPPVYPHNDDFGVWIQNDCPTYEKVYFLPGQNGFEYKDTDCMKIISSLPNPR